MALMPASDTSSAQGQQTAAQTTCIAAQVVVQATATLSVKVGTTSAEAKFDKNRVVAGKAIECNSVAAKAIAAANANVALKSTAVTVDAPEAKFKAASTASFNVFAAKDNQKLLLKKVLPQKFVKYKAELQT